MPTRGSLLLEVYQSGGVLVDWTVASDVEHVRPYLIGPQNYEGQEIDPVSAGASIGTVEVGVIDPAQTPGDQDTGWMTERLGSIRGKRCRLRRYIDADQGYITIADGPAGVPRLDASYAAYLWAIRDTREIERKLKAFNAGASTGILPRGPINGFGTRPDDSLLLDPVTPLIGTYQVEELTGLRRGRIMLDWDGAEPFPELVIDKDQEAASMSQPDGARGIHTKADILWRLAGSSDPWNVARPVWPQPFAYGSFSLFDVEATSLAGEDVRAVRSVLLWLKDPAEPYTGLEPFDGTDDTDQELEFIVRYRGPASEEFPFYYEGEAGDLIADLYDGHLSGIDALSEIARVNEELYDPAGLQAQALLLTGGGVKYDAAAVAQMTDRVLLRQVKPVDDARDFAESKVYGPSGWIPALDGVGRISPVSRARPASVDGPLLNQANCEPTSDWNAGERVVSSVGLNYNRYFIGEGVEVEADGLSVQPINLEYEDADAEATEGDNPVTYDAAVFSAVGDTAGQQLEGDAEAAQILAQNARYDVLNRYRSGAQAIRVRVRRSDAPTLRIGDWCPAQLPWLPNTYLGVRGLDLQAVQVLSIDDSEYAWRYLLLEESNIAGQPGYFDSGEKISDNGDPGYFDDAELISDEEEP